MAASSGSTASFGLSRAAGVCDWTEARAGVAGLLLTISFRPEPRGRGDRGAGGVGEVTRVRGWLNQKLE